MAQTEQETRRLADEACGQAQCAKDCCSQYQIDNNICTGSPPSVLLDWTLEETFNACGWVSAESKCAWGGYTSDRESQSNPCTAQSSDTSTRSTTTTMTTSTLTSGSSMTSTTSTASTTTTSSSSESTEGPTEPTFSSTSPEPVTLPPTESTPTPDPEMCQDCDFESSGPCTTALFEDGQKLCTPYQNAALKKCPANTFPCSDFPVTESPTSPPMIDPEFCVTHGGPDGALCQYDSTGSCYQPETGLCLPYEPAYAGGRCYPNTIDCAPPLPDYSCKGCLTGLNGGPCMSVSFRRICFPYIDGSQDGPGECLEPELMNCYQEQCRICVGLSNGPCVEPNTGLCLPYDDPSTKTCTPGFVSCRRGYTECPDCANAAPGVVLGCRSKFDSATCAESNIDGDCPDDFEACTIDEYFPGCSNCAGSGSGDCQDPSSMVCTGIYSSSDTDGPQCPTGFSLCTRANTPDRPDLCELACPSGQSGFCRDYSENINGEYTVNACFTDPNCSPEADCTPPVCLEECQNGSFGDCRLLTDDGASLKTCLPKDPIQGCVDSVDCNP